MQRVFIGIPLDKSCQKQIDTLLHPIRESHRSIRWVPENNRHLTLAFLGNIRDQQVENLHRSFDDAYQREAGFLFRLNALTRFPDPAGRIIALVNDPAPPLDGLFQITLAMLRELTLEPDRKDFRPHVTLGKIKNPRQMRAKFEQQADVLLKVEKVQLFKSILTETGPVYTSLKETLLRHEQKK